jgi:hypothetical protein
MFEDGEKVLCEWENNIQIFMAQKLFGLLSPTGACVA